MTLPLQTITVEVSARRIATVRLNRPERGNAFDQLMLDELAETLGALGADDAVRILVLRGSGRHFCTGADLAARAAAQGTEGEGATGTHASLRDVLARLGVQPIEAKGQQFNPHIHEAVEMVDTPDAPDHEVLEEWQRGYKYKDRLLRPSMVKVARNAGK